MGNECETNCNAAQPNTGILPYIYLELELPFLISPSLSKTPIPKQSLNPEMAIRAAAAAFSANSQWGMRMGMGVKAFSSSFPNFSFDPPQTKVEKAPPAEPSTNLFVSGTSRTHANRYFGAHLFPAKIP